MAGARLTRFLPVIDSKMHFTISCTCDSRRSYACAAVRETERKKTEKERATLTPMAIAFIPVYGSRRDSRDHPTSHASFTLAVFFPGKKLAEGRSNNQRAGLIISATVTRSQIWRDYRHCVFCTFFLEAF